MAVTHHEKGVSENGSPLVRSPYGIEKDVAVANVDSIDYGGSPVDHDAAEMDRMGKEQEFRRVFTPVSVFGFSCIYTATWECILLSVATGLTDGGFGGLVWEYVATIVAFGAVVLSLAEMASMAPTDGASYHWVSEFAPRSLQRHLSYATGWASTLGWLAGQTSGFYQLYTLTQAMINVYHSEFILENWQATLIMIAYICVVSLFNTVWASWLPRMEEASLFLHLAGFIVTLVPLWVMVPNKNSAHDVFLEVTNGGGWSSTGFSCLVGTVAIVYSTLGPDAAVHIAEEVQDAGRILPWTIVSSYYLNAVMGFIMLVTMLFTVGPLEAAIDADAPFINSYAATGSPGMNFALVVVLWACIALGTITCVATTSRQFFAFARDRGLPAWRWVARVDHRFNVPRNSVYIVSVLSSLLCLINIGSTTAFNIIVSLSVVAFFFTYILAIGCLALRKIKGDPLPPARWSLGRWGLPINIFAVGYSVLVFVLSSMPTAVPVKDAGDANFAPAIFVTTLLIALVAYLLQGRKIYEGPVVHVAGHREAGITGVARTPTKRGSTQTEDKYRNSNV